MTDKEQELVQFVKEYVRKKRAQLAARKAKHKKTCGTVSQEQWPTRRAVLFMHKLVRMVDEL